MRDDFFHNIVHELRTPLATILMYARLLREGKSIDEEKSSRFLGVIEQESDRLQKMVRQMLELAKLETRELQRSGGPVNLHRVLDQVLPPLVDRAAQSGLIFQHDVPAALPLVEGDHETLYMVLKNLVENAIKFSSAGTVAVQVSADEEQVSVAISDEGIGIPAEALPNLFQRFYRTQLAVERGIAGTGLGLYMVKEALTRYHGSIEVASKEGAGTTFTVRFPIALREPLETMAGLGR
jgi:two-component system phosphate regulon sensor histidine kinase PhoR